MREYMVRFWKRMLKIGKDIDDIEKLKNTGIITEEEYNEIIAP